MAQKLARSGEVFRTVQAKPGPTSLIKPGELVDLVEVTPLTLADRRIYNLLLENAWDAIDRPVTHTVAKSQLRGSHNSNDRIGESIERLMGAIVKVQVTRDAETTIERVQLLGGNVEHQTPDGLLHYEIPPRLRRIIKDSTIFARLQKEVMFALTSKYALCLYEMVQKRGNLTYKNAEDFPLAALRAVLGVPKGKLTTWSNLHNRAIAKAVQEVNELSDYIVQVEPLKTGRRVTGVRLRWWRKDADGLQAAARELERPKVGRTARLQGRVERVAPPPGALPPRTRPQPPPTGPGTLRSETYETARLRHPGYDIYFVEQEWRAWAMDREAPRDADQAYLAFFRRYAEDNPL